MRKIVRTKPEIIFTAGNMPCEVKVCVPSLKRSRKDNPLVMVCVGAADVIPEPTKVGDPMPFNSQYSLFIEAGKVLWAYSDGESILTIEAFPWSR